MKILVYGEGPQDMGRGEDEHARVVCKLVQRIVSLSCGVPERAIETTGAKLAFLSKRGLDGKATAAIHEADRMGFDAAVIVVDRDGNGTNGTKRKKLDDGRLDARNTTALPAAIGVAVETMDAWLLADERALTAAMGVSVARQPNPETLTGKPGTVNHPKTKLDRLIVQPTTQLKTQIAGEADLDLVAKRCPAGFAAFRADLQHEFAPLKPQHKRRG
jgi:hypothetical protein